MCIRDSLLALRQVNAAEREGLAHWKPGIIPALDFCVRGVPGVLDALQAQLGGARRLFLSIDLDGLSPHEVPAVEAPYPGGPSLRELLALMHALAGRYELVGMDITEFLPAFDPAKLTALTAARLVKEFSAL